MNAGVSTARADKCQQSQQQAELIARLRRYPSYVSASELVFGFDISGPVDCARLLQAIQQVVGRHPILASGVRSDDTDAVFIETTADVSGVETGPDWDSFAQALLALRHDPTTLWKGRALFRARVAPTQTGAFVGIVVNHLIFDGWSMLVFCREISAAYTDRKIDPRSPGISRDHSDYVTAQNRLAGPALGEVVDYWSQRIQSGSLLWNDPFPAEDPQAVSERHTQPYGADFATRVGALAAQWRTTPFAVLQVLSAAGFHQICGARQFLTSCNSSGRGTDYQEAIGPFVNTLYTGFDAQLLHEPHALLAQILQDRIAAFSAPAEVYMPAIMDRMGGPFSLKVNFLELPGLSAGATLGEMSGVFRIPEAQVTRRDIDRPRHLLRGLEMTWIASPNGFELLMYYKAPVQRQHIHGMITAITTALTTLQNTITPT